MLLPFHSAKTVDTVKHVARLSHGGGEIDSVDFFPFEKLVERVSVAHLRKR